MACVCSIKEEINRNIPVYTKKRNKNSAIPICIQVVIIQFGAGPFT